MCDICEASFKREPYSWCCQSPVSEHDARQARVFAQFLTEPGWHLGRREWHPDMDTREKREAWRRRWLPWLNGETTGPITPVTPVAQEDLSHGAQ